MKSHVYTSPLPVAPVTKQSSTPIEALPSFGDLWNSILSHLYLVALVAMAGILLGLYVASSPLRYTSTTTLRIQPANGSALAISAQQALSGGGADVEKINTEVTMMQSRAIFLKVADDLHLIDKPEFWGSKKVPHLSLADPAGRDRVMKRMKQILVFTMQPRSDIVQISCTTSSPLLSAEIPNAITNEYIAHIFQVRYGSTERVSTWLVGQLNDLKDQVERDQTELIGLSNKLGILGLDQKNSTYLLADSLEGITKASNEATIQRIVAEAKLHVLQSSDPNLIESAQPPLQNGQQQPGLLQTLRASQAEAAAAYANLVAGLGPNYPDVREAKARLDELNKAVGIEQQRILNQAQSSYSAAASNEKMTSDILSSLKTKAFASHDEMVRYVVLQRQYEADRLLYESLVQRLRVAGINAGLESAQVDVADLADVASIPQSPLPYQKFVVCLFLSLLAGMLLAIVVDRLDKRLRGPENAERLLGLPLLSVLRKFSLIAGSGIFQELETGPYAEGQQLLRSSVLLSQAERPPNSILITSASPGEGKSTVSRGLAAMLAMHNSRVLLIDADLRRPAQSKFFRLPVLPGLSDVLTSTIEPEDLILPISDVKGLFLLPSGRTPPQPATLLSSDRMREVIEQLKSQFDFLIIDSPPVLRVSDTLLIASLVEAVVVVVREKTANVKEVRHTIDLLLRSRANLVGFAMNGTTDRGSGYNSYYQEYGNYESTTDVGSDA
jgi:succinoglycan biosynthesis transport protein ExoP